MRLSVLVVFCRRPRKRRQISERHGGLDFIYESSSIPSSKSPNLTVGLADPKLDRNMLCGYSSICMLLESGLGSLGN